MKVLATERSRQLAEQKGWSLAYAQGNVDGEISRRLGKALALQALVGIDEYSLGFRAGYFERPNIDACVARAEPVSTDGTRCAGTSSAAISATIAGLMSQASRAVVVPTIDRKVRRKFFKGFR